MINNARVESDARLTLGTSDGANPANAALIGADDQSGSEGGYDEDYEGLAGRPAGPATPVTAPVATTASAPMSVAAVTTKQQQQ